ncbi:MAG: Hsp20/alpha crystallin family protein [Proteobacteria bacterium]|nr:Hsp20/alpha crystallin family protein [Pseudomonadota bacterium]
MTRIPRDILERLGYFHREVEALFRRLFDEELGTGALEDKPPFPPVDVIETAEEILVRADLPGTDRDSIELYGAPNFLVIRGTKNPETEKWTYLRIERSFGAFQRLIVLPAAGDPARVEARYDRGVLEVRIPRVVERRKIHRQIPID